MEEIETDLEDTKKPYTFRLSIHTIEMMDSANKTMGFKDRTELVSCAITYFIAAYTQMREAEIETAKEYGALEADYKDPV